MSIEDVVKAMDYARPGTPSSSKNAHVSQADVYALLDAYRVSMQTQAIWRSSSIHRFDEVLALTEERDALKEENERLKRSLSACWKPADDDLMSSLVRETELKAENARLKEAAKNPCDPSGLTEVTWDDLKRGADEDGAELIRYKLQRDDDLRARLEAERVASESRMSYIWIDHRRAAAEAELAEEKRLSRGSGNRFRRLAKRYLGLRETLGKALETTAGDWIDQRVRAEATEQKVKELELQVTATQTQLQRERNDFQKLAERVQELESFCTAKGAIAAAATARADELQKRVDELYSSRPFQENNHLQQLQCNDLRRAEHAENIAMGSAFELSRALEMIRVISHPLTHKAFREQYAERYLAAFDAPGGAK